MKEAHIKACERLAIKNVLAYLEASDMNKNNTFQADYAAAKAKYGDDFDDAILRMKEGGFFDNIFGELTDCEKLAAEIGNKQVRLRVEESNTQHRLMHDKYDDKTIVDVVDVNDVQVARIILGMIEKTNKQEESNMKFHAWYSDYHGYQELLGKTTDQKTMIFIMDKMQKLGDSPFIVDYQDELERAWKVIHAWRAGENVLTAKLGLG